MSVKKRNNLHSRPEKLGNRNKKKKLTAKSQVSGPKKDKKDDAKRKQVSKTQKKLTANKKKRRSPKRIPKNKPIYRKKHWRVRIKRTLLEFGVSLVILGILLYVLSFFVFSITKIEGYSMAPTLNNGEWFFVNKLTNPRRFKLVLYRDSESQETSIRRVVGLPGENIYYKDDQLYINNNDVYERFLEIELKRAKSSKTVYTENWYPDFESIPQKKYIVLGDNRPYATDSREYSYIDESEIIGVVEMRIFPIHQIQQF